MTWIVEIYKRSFLWLFRPRKSGIFKARSGCPFKDVRTLIHPTESQFTSSQEPWKLAQTVCDCLLFFTLNFFFLPLPFTAMKMKGVKKKWWKRWDMRCLCVLHPCLCMLWREKARGRQRGTDERENETEKEMRFVISSVHPGPLSRAAFYRRQSSPWRRLKTQMDGKLWCISNTPVIHT